MLASRNTMILLLITGLFVLFIPQSSRAEGAISIHHDLKLTLNLSKAQLQASDTIRLPPSYQAPYFEFQLNRDFRVNYLGKRLTAQKTYQQRKLYRIKLTANLREITLNYTGSLPSTPQCQFTIDICSLFNKKGVYLNPALAWYPMSQDLHTFDLNASFKDEFTKPWHSITQGKQLSQHQWQMDKPQDAIYFIAGNFHVYRKKGGVAEAQVYLLNDDAALAQRYLTKTQGYLNYYQNLLGAYPYHKFATVESFWESGWGMPAFTLLGSRVMRFSFILDSSLPHEILHNWWGNSVYIDPSYGNWSEGLTAYLSDYLLKETTKEKQYSNAAIAYRRNALHKYASFTQKGKDFPIKDFRSRHNAATQAIGYSKLLMVFHTLRQQLGDQQFFNALKQFYHEKKFHYANMQQLLDYFAKNNTANKQALQPFFQQWIMQADAPTVTIKNWQLNNGNETNQLSITLQQKSNTKQIFTISLPIYAKINGKNSLQKSIELNKAEQTFHLTIPKTVKQIAIDPYFEVLRKPLIDEIPANVQAFRDPSTKKIILADQSSWWKKLAKQLQQRSPETFRANSEKVATLIQFGLTTNDFNHPENKALGLTISDTMFEINGQSFPRDTHSLVFAKRNAKQQTHITFLANNAQQAAKVLRKVRHYGKYSYLVFDVDGSNQLKGEWLLSQSPLSIDLMMDSAKDSSH